MPSSFHVSKLQIIILSILLIGIVGGVYLVQKQQIFKSRAYDTSTINIGFNVRGLAHYGYHDLYPNASDSQIDTVLGEVKRLNGSIIRIYLANKYISNAQAAERLDQLLTCAEPYGISFIVSLINEYVDTGNFPKGAEKCYDTTTASDYPIPLLNRAFFADDYKTFYLPFVETVVSKNKQHPNIYAWEVGNELKSNDYDTFTNFVESAASFIKNIDPTHKISTGFLRAHHITGCNLNATDNTGCRHAANDLYSRLPSIDIVSVNSYDGEKLPEPDIEWAVQHGKTAIMAEIAMKNDDADYVNGGLDRSRLYYKSISYWKSLGIKAVLLWGFLPKNMDNTGDGDNIFGMDTIWHGNDYDSIASVLQLVSNPSYASQISNKYF